MRLIDADALKDTLVNDMVVDGWETITAYMKGKIGRSDYIDGIVDALACIDDADTVDPVKHGKWLRTPTWWAYCSVCGMEPPNESNEQSEYCPNCGARMMREDDDKWTGHGN